MRYLVFLLFCFSSFVSGEEVDEKNSKSDLLSINGCEFYYDNKKFDFEWPVEKLVEILGEPEQYFIDNEYTENRIYITWEDIGITIKRFVYEDGVVSSDKFIKIEEDI
jgi:hypothetical protein